MHATWQMWRAAYQARQQQQWAEMRQVNSHKLAVC